MRKSPAPSLRKDRHEEAAACPCVCCRRAGCRRRVGANLSVASDHLDRAVPGRRSAGHHRPHPGGADARFARPAGGGRERPRRGRQSRRRPPRPRRARRLHHRHRAVEHARRQSDHLQAALPRARRFRADCAPHQHAAADHRAQGLPGEGRQGADRLAQGQSRQGHRRDRRRRRRRAGVVDLFCRQGRHQAAIRAVQGRRTGRARDGCRPDRPHARPGGECARPRARRARSGPTR